MAKVSFACLESLNEGINEVISSIDDVEVNEHFDDLNDSVEQLNDININTNDVITSTTALQEITDVAQNMDTPSEAVMEAMAIAINHHARIINNAYEREIVPIIGTGVALEDLVSTIGKITGFVTRLRTTIRNAIAIFTIASKAFHDAVTSLYQLAEKFLKHTKKLREKVQQLQSTPRLSQIQISHCRILNFKGKSDAKSIILGARATDKIVETVTGEYRKKLFNHYENVFVSYQKAIKEAGYVDYEDAASSSKMGIKILNDFKGTVEKTFKAAIGTMPDNYEISGGYIFGFKNVDMTVRPRLYDRDTELVSPRQTINTPTISEMKEMLDLSESISRHVYDRKTWLLGDVAKLVGDGYSKVSDMKQADKDDSKLMRVLGGIDGFFAASSNLLWYTTPIANTSRVGFAVSRGLLSVVEKSITAYSPK